MKRTLLFFLLILTCSLSAQENNRGTIKGQKKLNIRSIHFDNVNNRLIGKDHYGNILDSVVLSYTMQITIQGRAYTEDVVGTTLSPLMQERLERIDNATVIFFSNIKVKDKNGTLINWPKFNATLGHAYESGDN